MIISECKNRDRMHSVIWPCRSTDEQAVIGRLSILKLMTIAMTTSSPHYNSIIAKFAAVIMKKSYRFNICKHEMDF